MKYSKKALINYLNRTSGVINQPTEDEVQTTCPLCQSTKLYFNVKKGIGLCHRASCSWHYKVSVEDLIGFFGFAPDQYGEWEKTEDKPEEQPVVLPGYPILFREGDQLFTNNQEALDYLHGRELKDEVILNWGLTFDGERIYVPIHDGDGNLVNFNSRSLDPNSKRKYLYCPGRKTSLYLLGWEEAKDWPELALVENTFVSLAYRARMCCTTNFGSHLSDVQANLIAESKSIKRVAILWDEGAEANMERGVRKLHKLGVKAAFWQIRGQPDDFPVDWVGEKCRQVMEATDNGINYLNFKGECKEIKDEH